MDMIADQPDNKRERSFKLAFLGGGIDSAIGPVHRIASAMDRRFELLAGCFSRDPQINSKTANIYGVAASRTYDTLDDLLVGESQKVHAVVILTPTNQHRDQILTCLTKGVSVISEKALAMTSADIREIKNNLSQKNGFLAVTYNYIGYPMVRDLQCLIREGRLGKIEQIHLEMPQEQFARLKANDNGAIVPQDWRLHDGRVPTISLDLGVHLHSLTHFLTSEKPIEVISVCNSFGNFRQIVDNVLCIAHYSNDVVSSIWYSKVALGARNGLKIRVYGTRGSAEWVQEYPELLQLADVHGRRYTLDRGHPDARVSNDARYTRFKAGHPAGFVEAFANCYFDIADALGDYLSGRNEPNRYVFGVDEALEGLQMLEAAADSHVQKRWIPVQRS